MASGLAVRTINYIVGTTSGTLGGICATALTRAGVVLAGFATTAAVAGAAWGAQDVALSMATPANGRLLTIDGSISGVRAGAPAAPLRLTLRNGGDAARAVTRVRADSTGVQAGQSACRGERYLTVGDWNGAVSVPAGGSATVTLPVAVSADLPAECVSAAWGLVYTAY